MHSSPLLLYRTQISEKQLYEAEKKFKQYESMIAVMEEEVREGTWGGGGATIDSSKRDWQSHLAPSLSLNSMHVPLTPPHFPSLRSEATLTCSPRLPVQRTSALLPPLPHPQERSNPDLLSKTAARRRRVAVASGHSETEVTTMMAAFTQMRSQVWRVDGGEEGGRR